MHNMCIYVYVYVFLYVCMYAKNMKDFHPKPCGSLHKPCIVPHKGFLIQPLRSKNMKVAMSAGGGSGVDSIDKWKVP